MNIRVTISSIGTDNMHLGGACPAWVFYTLYIADAIFLKRKLPPYISMPRRICTRKVTGPTTWMVKIQVT